jgi:hypothetical protein
MKIIWKIKKSRPISRVLSWAIIHLGCTSPCTSSNLPGNSAGRTIVSLFGLAPGGVYPATTITSSAVRSYRTISPLPAETGGIFSVALSIDSRRPEVIWHLALWSPDFPLLNHVQQRLPGRLCRLVYCQMVYLQEKLINFWCLIMFKCQLINLIFFLTGYLCC